MNSERSSNSVNESGSTTSTEELTEGPLHSDFRLDGISWLDLQLTAGGDVEFKDVLNTDKSILTAEGLRDWAVTGDGIIPLVVSDLDAVLVDSSGLGSWVSDPNRGSDSLSEESEEHLLGRGTCHGDVVDSARRGLEDSREPAHSYLTCVESIPHMVHVRVKLVAHVSSLLSDVDRLHGSVPFVLIFTFEE